MKKIIKKLSIMTGVLCLMLAGAVFGGNTGSAQTISVDSGWISGHRDAIRCRSSGSISVYCAKRW